jgi:hypothetical protein
VDFTVEFYETEAGKCPVREFLDELKASDPDDFAAVVAGLAELRNRQYDRTAKSEPNTEKGILTTECVKGEGITHTKALRAADSIIAYPRPFREREG